MASKVTQKELNEKFEGLKAILKNVKSSQGKDLYSHLQEVFKKLILHYPDQALEKLEEVSYLVKHSGKLKIEDYLKLSDFRNYRDLSKEMKDYIKIIKPLFGGVKPQGEDEEEAEPTEAAPVGFV
jgi:hypothetical protein